MCRMLERTLSNKTIETDSVRAEIISAGIIYLACLWPLVRLLSRFEHRQIALH